MKKVILSIALFYSLSTVSKAQTKVFVDESGNYVQLDFTELAYLLGLNKTKF